MLLAAAEAEVGDTWVTSTLPGSDDIDYVIHISVDGLRSDVISALGPDRLPNLYRIIREGSTTDNARCDVDYTQTLPNHITQLTGRPTLGPNGHQFTDNRFRDSTWTLHNNPFVPEPVYLPSVFDVVHDHGLRTGLYASKDKFLIFDQSYNNRNGTSDDVEPDHGRDKIDVFHYIFESGPLMDQLLADFEEEPFHYVFFHVREPDHAGHAHTWSLEPGSDYTDAVEDFDDALGNLLTFIESSPLLNGRTVVLLTSDHGGGNPPTNHNIIDAAVNYTVPFYAWGAFVASGQDLYELNALHRTDPDTAQIAYDAAEQPIRNGDIANLAMDLLGLPPVPGSFFNLDQALRVLDADPNQLPTALFDADPVSGDIPLTVHFDASASSDADGQIVRFEWDFGDGTADTTMVVDHTYELAGEYLASLRVIDDRNGQSTARTTISVIDPNPPVLLEFQDGLDGYNGTSDAHILEAAPTRNFGIDPMLEVDGNPDKAALIRWDLSNIRPGGSVLAASFEVTVTEHVAEGETYEVYALKQPWNEAEVTREMYADGQHWQQIGGAGPDDRYADTLAVFEPLQAGPYEVALNEQGLARMQAWIDDPASNQGMIVLDYENASDGLDFHSSDAPDALSRPKLRIMYRPPVGGHTVDIIEDIPTDAIDLSHIEVLPAFPNPFSPATRLQFQVRKRQVVQVRLYDIRGRFITTLYERHVPARTWQHVTLDGSSLPSGTYMIHIMGEAFSQTEWAVLVK